ncbi:MAG: hypothetical protein H6837_08625 [Planctomycetes bacterium]|nr:hypothetical protein [Planctomycetota bacterium]
MRSILLIVAVLGADLASQGLLADIRKPSPGETAGAAPRWFTVAAGKAWFVARTAAHGEELWVTDGTTAGTSLVVDLWPGSGSSSPRTLTPFGSAMLFIAAHPTQGVELWRSDGSAAGTAVVKDIAAGDGDAFPDDPEPLAVVGGKVLFAADDGVHGRELWISDGTAAGTSLVQDLVTGPIGSAPAHLTAVGSAVFFTASEANGDRELWKSDGTAAGTVKVKDIVPGATGSAPDMLTAVGGKVFFTADDGSNGRELWVSDGTAAGTALVRDLTTGSAGSTFTELVALGSSLVFVTSNNNAPFSFWVSDGTTAGTTNLAPRYGPPINPRQLRSVGSRVLFLGHDNLLGLEVWTTDGTAAGTKMVRDTVPGNDGVFPELWAAGNEVWFLAWQATRNDWEPWRSDGTSAGTVPVADIRLGGQGSGATGFVALGSKVVFAADDGVHGAEPWISDGTSVGTGLLRDVEDAEPGSGVEKLFRVGERALFLADDGVHGRELWGTDGTAAGTALLVDLTPGPAGTFLTLLNAIEHGTANGIGYLGLPTAAQGTELWRSDGTPAGTQLIVDLNPGAASSAPSEFVELGGVVLFAADDGTRGRELWKSDGTATGTVLVRDIRSGSGGSDPTGLVRLGGFVYFAADDGVSGIELWRSDGTANGTTLVRDIRVGVAGSIPRVFGLRARLVATDTHVLFAADDGTTGYELWRSDGTNAGTVLVRDISPGPGSAFLFLSPSPSDFVASGGLLFFGAYDPALGFEPWRSDGTAAGTFLLRDIVPGVDFSLPRNMVTANGRVYFQTLPGATGAELWTSDGTVAGTVQLKDILPGKRTGTVGWTVPTGDDASVAFVADDGVRGREIWISDGTAGGTQLVTEMVTGPGDAAPTYLLRLGTKVLCAGTDRRGTELWSIPLAQLCATLAEPFGRGCPGTGGRVPKISRSGLLVRGNPSFRLQLSDARPSSPAALLLGPFPAELGVGGGCSLYVAPPILTFGVATDASGAVQLPFAIPNDPSLKGAEAYLQWIVVDPAGQGLGAGATSNGMRCVVG